MHFRLLAFVRRWPLIIWPVLGGLLTASLAVYVIGPQKAAFGDAADYLAAAQSLVTQHSYPRTASLPFFRPPLYPLFIAALWLLKPGSVIVIKIGQILLFASTCGLLYRIGRQLGARSTAACLGGLLYAVNPFTLLPVTDVQTETLHTFLVTLGIYLLLRWLGTMQNAWLTLGAAGAVWGLAALCRPSAWPIGLVLAGGIVLLARRKVSLLRRLAAGALMAVGLFAVLLPFAVANYRATGELIWISDGSGFLLWLGNHPAELLVYERAWPNQKDFNDYSYNYLQVELVNQQIAQWENAGGYYSRSLMERNALWRQAALDNMRAQPAATARLWAYKTLAYWRPWLHAGAYPLKQVIISGFFVVPLFLLAILGAWRLWREGSETNRISLLLLGLLFIASTGFHTISHVMVRFRLPYVDPYLMILAGVALVWGADKIRHKRPLVRELVT